MMVTGKATVISMRIQATGGGLRPVIRMDQVAAGAAPGLTEAAPDQARMRRNPTLMSSTNNPRHSDPKVESTAMNMNIRWRTRCRGWTSTAGCRLADPAWIASVARAGTGKRQ
jgi:hypothetical protein